MGINSARVTAACSLVVLDLRPSKCVLSTFGDPSLVLCKQDSVYTFACNVFIGFPESGFSNSLNYEGDVHSFKNVLGMCYEPGTVLCAGYPVPGLTRLS